MEPTTFEPVISVVMPFYNVEPFLAESIDSVISQSYSDWELLLIDDGSSDGSTEIARAFVNADPRRIQYFAHENRRNRGASASRNLGFKHARGQYVALLDADDVWLPSHLETQIEILDTRPDIECVYGSVKYWYSWTGVSEDLSRDYVVTPGFPAETVVPPPRLLIAMVQGTVPVPCSCTLLMRRSTVLQVDGFVDRFRQVFTDQAFYAKYFLVFSTYVIDDCTAQYRIRENSSVAVASKEGRLQATRYAYLRWFLSYLEKNGKAGGELERVVKRAMWPHQHPGLHRVIRTGRRLREAVAASFWNGVVPVAFAVSRLLLPRAIRHWLWTRWEDVRRCNTTAPPPRV